MKISVIEILSTIILISAIPGIVSFFVYKRKAREDFTREICALMESCIEKTRGAWGYRNGIERFLATMRRNHIKALEKIPGCDKYLSYVMLGKLKNEKFKKFDFQTTKIRYFEFKEEGLSVKLFLQKLIDRAHMYQVRRDFAISQNYTEVMDFNGPQKIFMKAEYAHMGITFLENLNQFISFEVSIPLYKFLEKSSEGGKITQSKKYYNFELFFSKADGKVKMDFHCHEWNEDFHFECNLKSFEEAVTKELQKYQVS